MPDEIQRPRWGTFSVIDHKDTAALVPEILLYDRLVFPVPDGDAETKRWSEAGRDLDLLKLRLDELQGLVHTTPWTKELHDDWSLRWEHMKKLGQDTQTVAMGITPMVLAMSAFSDHFPPPIMIAAYQDPIMAKVDLTLSEAFPAPEPSLKPSSALDELESKVRALFERRLDMPIVMHPYQTYQKAIKLAHDMKYQQARRSLFDWEDKILASQIPIDAALKELEHLVDTHDEFIKMAFEKTVKRNIYRVAEFGASALVAHYTGRDLAGAATEGVLRLVGAKLPMLDTKPPDPLAQPSAALHKAISVMFHEVMFPEL